MPANRSWSGLLPRLAFAGLAFGMVAPAAAQECRQWDLSGQWWTIQRGVQNARFNIRQNGSTLVGTAVQYYSGGTAGRPVELDGTVNGSEVEIIVYWSGRSVGVYKGRISGAGRVEGQTRDRMAPQNRSNFHSDRRMQCVSRASVPPPPAKTPAAPKPQANPANCVSGYVWRLARPQDLVCVSPAARDRTAAENAAASLRYEPNGAYGPFTCKSGFVWREAYGGDVVCVTPEVRATVREENRLGPTRRAGG